MVQFDTSILFLKKNSTKWFSSCFQKQYFSSHKISRLLQDQDRKLFYEKIKLKYEKAKIKKFIMFTSSELSHLKLWQLKHLAAFFVINVHGAATKAKIAQHLAWHFDKYKSCYIVKEPNPNLNLRKNPEGFRLPQSHPWISFEFDKQERLDISKTVILCNLQRRKHGLKPRNNVLHFLRQPKAKKFIAIYSKKYKIKESKLYRFSESTGRFWVEPALAAFIFIEYLEWSQFWIESISITKEVVTKGMYYEAQMTTRTPIDKVQPNIFGDKYKIGSEYKTTMWNNPLDLKLITKNKRFITKWYNLDDHIFIKALKKEQSGWDYRSDVTDVDPIVFIYACCKHNRTAEVDWLDYLSEVCLKAYHLHM